MAWIIGWDLIIEYAMGNVAVAVSWSGYFVELLKGFGLVIPPWLTTDLATALKTPGFMDAAPHVAGIPIVFNLPAAAITLLLTWILVIGIKESARFNTGMVVLKLIILVFFIIVGAMYVKPANWHPFSPNGLDGNPDRARRSSSSPTSASTPSRRPPRSAGTPRRTCPSA